MNIKERIKEILSENDQLKFAMAKSMGLTHSSHAVYTNSAGTQFKWDGFKFVEMDKKESEANKSIRDSVLKNYPEAYVHSSFEKGSTVYRIVYPKKGKGGEVKKLMSVGQGKTPEDAWKMANAFFGSKKEVDNSKTISHIENIKSNLNWDSLGNIQYQAVQKFVQKLQFDTSDIGSRIKSKELNKWDDVIELIKQSKYNIGIAE